MSKKIKDLNKAGLNRLSHMLGGVAAYVSFKTFFSAAAFSAAGFLGVAGATLIGFATVAVAAVTALGGAALGAMASVTIQDRQPKEKRKQLGPLTMAASPVIAGSVLGALAGHSVVYEPLKDEVLRRLPAPTETQTPEAEKKPGSVMDLSSLTGSANERFSRNHDQVLMRDQNHALVMPASRPSR